MSPEARPETYGIVQTLRALVVDDDAVNRKVLKMILDFVPSEVVPACDGAEALALFKEGDFDIVLMDLQMPIMDGLTTIREIRKWEASTALPRTPILVVTANNLREHAESAAAVGADGYTEKPLDPTRLLKAIQGVLAATT